MQGNWVYIIIYIYIYIIYNFGECVAGSLSPEDYDLFALPYQKMVVKAIKDKAPKNKS